MNHIKHTAAPARARSSFIKTTCAGLATVWLTLGSAHAALSSQDYVDGSADGLITYDSATGQQWLDIPLTAGLTYDQVRTSTWVTEKGFHIATQAEVQTLFDHADATGDSWDHPAGALALVQLLGPTLISGTRISTAGFTGSDFFGNDVTSQNYPVGTPFSALLGKVDYLGQLEAGGPELGMAHFGGGHPFSDQASEYYGAFLVRSVPEPSSYALMGLGLAAIAVRGRIAGRSRMRKQG